MARLSQFQIGSHRADDDVVARAGNLNLQTFCVLLLGVELTPERLVKDCFRVIDLKQGGWLSIDRHRIATAVGQR